MVVVSVHISTEIISVREDYTTSNISIKLIREWLGRHQCNLVQAVVWVRVNP